MDEARINFITNWLEGAGFNAPLNALRSLSNQEDAASILDCIFALLSQIQREYKQRDELQDRLRNAFHESEILNKANAKLKQSLESSERQVKLLSNKLSATESELKDVSDKYQAAKEEAAKATVDLTSVKSQYQHKLKKKETEYNSLRDRIHKLANEKAQAQKLGLKLLNPLQPKVLLPSKVKKSENEMYDIVINNFEEMQKELLAENQALKHSLYEVFVEGKETIKETADEEMLAAIEENLQVDEARFQLPISLIHDDVIARFKNLYSQMAMVHYREDPAINFDERENPIAQSDELEAALEEIERYREIISKQNELLQRAVDSNGAKSFPAMEDPEDYDISRADLEQFRIALDRREKQLDEERAKFTEAAVRLGRERSALEREKEALEDERRALETQKILQELPQTPAWLKEGNTADFIGNISNSPAPSSRTTTPMQKAQSKGKLENNMESARRRLLFGAVEEDEIVTELNTFATTPSTDYLRWNQKENEDATATTTPSTIKSALKKSALSSAKGSAGKDLKVKIQLQQGQPRSPRTDKGRWNNSLSATPLSEIVGRSRLGNSQTSVS
ncbi:Afadin- and alpha-actinin-binding protein [Chytridiales sp. JEL 0842]|nr:Afadin- and alpha-actinin-binding protein [Chytridiales sp. JEL 0842]